MRGYLPKYMMPNRQDKDRAKNIVFQCEAGCNDYLRFYFNEDDKADFVWANVSVCCGKFSFWKLLWFWWQKKDMHWVDISLSREDVTAMRDRLTEWLEKEKV